MLEPPVSLLDCLQAALQTISSVPSAPICKTEGMSHHLRPATLLRASNIRYNFMLTGIVLVPQFCLICMNALESLTIMEASDF